MSDDYIRLAAPTYPEMQYCYSPVYDSYLNNKGTAVNVMSSPRTKRSHYRLRKKENMLLNPPVPLTKQPTHEGGTEDNNNNNNNDVNFRQDKPLPPTPLRKQSAPTLCVTEASKANSSSSRPRFADDTAAMPSLHKETVIRSHTRTTSSTTFSFHGGGSEHATITSLHPSIESAIDPSPRSSPDASEQQSSFSLPQPSEAASRKEEKEESPAMEPAKEELPPLEYTKKKLTPLAPPAPPGPRIAIPIEIQNMRRRRRYPRQAATQAATSTTPAAPPKPAPPKSALTALIAERASTADNPFSEFSFVSGRGESNPITLCVYLPHSAQPYDPVSLVVKPDAIVDDVIGYILYDYVEKKRKPALEEDIYDLSNWMLRIAEDDGEIEEDLPALDRTRQISMVSFDQFALCRTPEGQVKQIEAIRAKMGRSGPTADSARNKKSSGNEPVPSGPLANGQEKAVDLGPLDPVPVGPIHQPEADSSAVAVPIPSSKAMLTKSTMPMTPLKYFRIRLMTNEEVSATTTIPVYAEMFIGDVLELVSRKRKLDPDEYMLTIADTNVVVPNDTTVESMREVTELCLIRKGAGLTIPSSSHIWRSPTKKKKDEMFYPAMFSTSSNTTTNNGIYSQYKKYFVNRKMPMFVGRRECIIAIDGDYVHIMPPEHKGMFDSVKTTSFHVNAVVSCKQSKKAPANFKITVTKDQSHKAYDFEAMNSKEAQEICSRINFLVQVCKAS